MEDPSLFNVLGYGALAFGLLVLGAPVLQVFRGRQRWSAIIGLCIAGSGFILIGVGLVLSARGFGSAVLPGILFTAVGHFVQQRAAKP